MMNRGRLHLSPSEPLFNIGLVSRLTGILPPTLRAWERRYGFPESVRTRGGQRLFSDEEVTRLRWVKRQVDSGMQVRQVVLAVRGTAGSEEILETGPFKTPIQTLQAEPSAAALRRRLLDELLKPDLEKADQMLGEGLTFFSIEELTLQVIGPVLAELGRLWQENTITVVAEHLASNYLRQRLLAWMLTGPPTRHANSILLACAPGELHEGNLLMLGVILRRQGWPLIHLGQAVPLSDLGLFVKTNRPSAVVLVALQASTAKTLKTWPKWIIQAAGRPLVAFGGGGFLENPELQKTMPGVYLGSTIPEGLSRLNALLQGMS